MHSKVLLAAIGALASLSAVAAPVTYNNDIVSGQAAFDATVTSAGGTVTTLPLSGLTAGLTSWTVSAGGNTVTITSTDGTNRFISSDYNGYRALGLSYAMGGQAVKIDPYTPEAGSGITFTFSTPVNAFGLQVADWATCCTDVTHPDTGAPTGSNLYISFDGGATRLVANAIDRDSNPGNKDYDGNGSIDYVYTNFVAAIDDSSTFSTVTFYGDGLGEELFAGGTLRWATVAQGSVSTPVPEPTGLALAGLALGSLVACRRRKA